MTFGYSHSLRHIDTNVQMQKYKHSQNEIQCESDNFFLCFQSTFMKLHNNVNNRNCEEGGLLCQQRTSMYT